MKSLAVGVAAFLVFVAILGQGNAIKCYSCSSRSRDDCLDPFNKTYQVLSDCDHHSSSSSSHYSKGICKKIKYRETDNGELITMRKCDWVTENSEHRDGKTNECSGSISSHWKIESCATCTEDGCNGSNRVVMASMWCALIPSFMYLFSKATQ